MQVKLSKKLVTLFSKQRLILDIFVRTIFLKVEGCSCLFAIRYVCLTEGQMFANMLKKRREEILINFVVIQFDLQLTVSLPP